MSVNSGVTITGGSMPNGSIVIVMVTLAHPTDQIDLIDDYGVNFVFDGSTGLTKGCKRFIRDYSGKWSMKKT